MEEEPTSSSRNGGDGIDSTSEIKALSFSHNDGKGLNDFLDQTSTKSMTEEEVYDFDLPSYVKLLGEAPWDKEAVYFDKVKISAIASIKMTMHASAGKNQEIMGIITGRVVGKTCMIIDSYPLPIVGTETRVTDMNSDPVVGEYMYHCLVEAADALGRKEKLVGWYHSHPGFGCWLSKVDVGTQMLCQKGGMGMVAIVVDPHQTKASGRIDLGAFRCYPEGNLPTSPQGGGTVDHQFLPKEKLLEFGTCANEYHKIEVEYFTTSFQQQMLEKLWREFWIKTLSSSSINENYNYSCLEIQDLSIKIDDYKHSCMKSTATENYKTRENILNQCKKISLENFKNLSLQLAKDSIFR